MYLLTDASRLFGLGYALGHMETDASGKEIFKIVHCGSKGLTPTQQRYSTIELECLVIVWATFKSSFYLRGLPLFTIYTDHRPLQGVFHKDIFDLASPRLQRLREKIAMYSFQVCWVPGKTHLILDALFLLQKNSQAWTLTLLFCACPRHLIHPYVSSTIRLMLTTGFFWKM